MNGDNSSKRSKNRDIPTIASFRFDLMTGQWDLTNIWRNRRVEIDPAIDDQPTINCMLDQLLAEQLGFA
jgi:hypothetical protein